MKEDEDFITITGIVTKLYFEELMDGRESFHDVEWDIQEYDEDAPPLCEEVIRLRELLDDYRRFHVWISNVNYDLIAKWDEMESEKE
jgi:hypothetical protein